MNDETDYRIEYTIQRRKPGEDDFTDIGFGSSSGWGTPDQAVHMVASEVQNYGWDTEVGMPGPREIKADVEAQR